MSIKALRWVRALKAPPTHKLILWALADMANKRSQCWPSMSALADATGLSDRGIQKAIPVMVEAGLLRVERSAGRRSNRYILTLAEPRTSFTVEPTQTPNPIRGELQAPCFDNPEPRSPSTPNVVRSTPNHVHPEPSEPPFEARELTLSPQSVAPADGFASWWALYPRKVGKDAARTAYAAALRRGATPYQLVEALKRQRWPDEMRFIPHPRTWLAQGRWQDDPRHGAPSAPEREELHDTIADIMRDPLGCSPTLPPSFDFEGDVDRG
ncbi:helix-turn-helix domain-containing protein [Roseococcus sp. SDR]|uniref:helix-turn-helix domain-containing protein n=1 Tax=Roseococcus sp. SDR TaxID=2835532 RepID=UPI001BCD932B|nr:helix-turn-helix domain-containing protein [Roseococcus sp. SDR]MBS7790088.1 helix-turn-helix domain-containing protein [Roseococcus sp. SDR]MBV1845402.1 helix-turn-helix domain-containing protein [Roseococcus sp. SDR]